MPERPAESKALLVGIDHYRDAPLRGCVNDVKEMRKLLLDRYGFERRSVKVLADGDATGQAIQDGLGWLADGTRPGDVRLFHYSGHGSYLTDQDGDEDDKLDECLVPADGEDGAFLRDDTLWKLYQAFPRGTHLVIVMDACHSGTNWRDDVKDIRYRFMLPPLRERKKARKAAPKKARELDAFGAGAPETPKSPVKKPLGPAFEVRIDEADGEIVRIAGCRADETSAEARLGDAYHGALTYCLLEQLAKAPRTTYERLIAAAGRDLRKRGFVQTPILECGKKEKAAAFLAR